MITITKSEFDKIAAYVHQHFGIYLKPEKEALVTGRLQSLLPELGYDSFTDYFAYVVSDRTGQAAETLINRISTNHTYFMREPEHFYHFRDVVLPGLAKTIPDHDLRVWCAASSSGEEPYTLAMLIDEFFGRSKIGWDTKLLATDVSTRVLEIATKGQYSADRIEPLPDSWKKNYFIRKDPDTYEVAPRLKSEVIFRNFNLMSPTFPFRKRFHVIFCRNVMIYFDGETRLNLIRKLYEFTEPGGYLYLGHSESLGRENTGYRYVMPAVYRKE